MTSRSRQAYPAFPVDYGTSSEDSGSKWLTPGVKKAAIGAGAGVGVPGLLYARGLRKIGVPLHNIPGALMRDVASLKTHEVAPGKFLHGTLGSFTGTMREGFTGTGGDIKGTSSRIWENIKAAAKGFRAPKNLPINKLSALLDDLIQFEVTEGERFNKAFERWKNSEDFQENVHRVRGTLGAVAGTTAGVGAVGAAGYGLYKRGQALGPVAGKVSPFGGESTGTKVGLLPKSLRSTKRVRGRTINITKGPYSTSKSRGILGNIIAGGEALPGDVSVGMQRAAQGVSILSHPMAREALAHDIRSSAASRLAKLATKVRP